LRRRLPLWARATLAVSVVGGAFVALFPYRLDNAAHVLGGAAVLFGFAAVSGRSDGMSLSLALVAVLALGWLGELTVFGPAHDALDVLVGGFGAAIAAAILLDHPLGHRDRLSLAVVVAALCFASLGLRYGVPRGAIS
jgi:hypothetical protein